MMELGSFLAIQQKKKKKAFRAQRRSRLGLYNSIHSSLFIWPAFFSRGLRHSCCLKAAQRNSLVGDKFLVVYGLPFLPRIFFSLSIPLGLRFCYLHYFVPRWQRVPLR